MSVFSSKIRDTLGVELRNLMKDEFLGHLSSQPDALGQAWPGAQLVVYGSSVMRRLQHSDHVSFPYSGRKCSDIDLSILPARPCSEYEFVKNFKEQFPPIMRDAVNGGRFGLIVLKHPDNINRDISPDDTAKAINIPPDKVKEFLNKDNTVKYLKEEFIVYRDFSRDEIREQIRRHHPDQMDAFAPAIEAAKEPMRVTLIVSNNMLEVPVLIDTQPLYGVGKESPPGKLSICRDNPLNLMASKVARNFFKDRFKETDFIDIYNLIHADPKLFDFSFTPPSPRQPAAEGTLDISDVFNRKSPPPSTESLRQHKDNLKNLRCLIVAQMARHGIHNVYDRDSNLMANFEPTEQNIDRFVAQMKVDTAPKGEWHDEGKKRAAAKMFLTEARELVFHAFGVDPSQAGAPRRLEEAMTLSEINFLTQIHGYAVLPGNLGTKQGDPQIDAQFLELCAQEHGYTLQKYPELKNNLEKNFAINERISNIRDMRSGMGITGE